MSQISKVKIQESLSFLGERYSKSKKQREKLKIQSLILHLKEPNKRQCDIAAHLCISHATLSRWYKQYQEEGFEEFIKEKRTGNNPSVVSSELHNALEKKLSDSSEPFQGYTDAVLYVRENYDQDIHYQTIRSYMRRHFGCKLKVPRKSHYKQDQEAVESFKKNRTDI